MSLALRHSIPELHKKLEYLEGCLASAEVVYAAEGPLDEEITCSETGKKIEGARYYASYLDENE